MMLRFLGEDDFDALLAAFNDAFSDYLVPFHTTAPQLREMLARRGVVLPLSPAIFDGDRIVAYTLNALGTWNGVATAYDSGTGVVLSHRRRGLARQLMEASFQALRVEQILLEVLEQNERAIALYRSLGFAITRKLDCWRYSGAGEIDAEAREIALDDAPFEFADVPPSWQNSIDCLRRSGDDQRVIAVDGGYAIVHAATGDLAQLAVDPARRRRGVGTRLLRHAAAVAGKSLRILNVDARSSPIRAFLEAAGAERFISQFEMARATLGA